MYMYILIDVRTDFGFNSVLKIIVVRDGKESSTLGGCLINNFMQTH